MANIENWDVASVSTTGVITADGGFVGDVTGAVTGNVTGVVTGDVTGRVFQSPATAYTDSGTISAIALTDGVAVLDASSNVTQMTLANGTAEGQRISIVCSDATNTCDVDATFGGTKATATFTVAGQAIDLVYTSFKWYVIGNNGATLS